MEFLPPRGERFVSPEGAKYESLGQRPRTGGNDTLSHEGAQ